MISNPCLLRSNFPSDDIFEVLQLDLLQEDILGSSSNASSDGDLSDEVSDEDTSDDLDWIDDEDVSMSYTSSDGNDDDDSDDSTLSDNELNTLDSDTENAPPSSFHMQAFNELKQMYTHRYETPHKWLPKPNPPFLKYVLDMLKVHRPDNFRAELRVSPHTFNCLIEAITNDPVFVRHSEFSIQAPVQDQLAVALYRFGHYGNAASL